MASGATLLAGNGTGAKNNVIDNTTATAEVSTTTTTAESALFASLDHDKRRKITLKCLELEEMLESQG